jgi:hypothetical protein
MKTEAEWENPGPNMSWCPTCQMWKAFGILVGREMPDGEIVPGRLCITCNASGVTSYLERRPI